MTQTIEEIEDLEDEAAPEAIIVSKTLWEALEKARNEAKYIRKIKKSGMNFFALPELAVIREGRRVMGMFGLLILPIHYELFGQQFTAEETSKDGKKSLLVLSAVRGTFRVVHVVSGEYIDVVAIGNSCGASDKAILGAQTLAMKRAVQVVLMIPAGEDPDGNEVKLPVAETPEQIAARRAAAEAKQKQEEEEAAAALKAQMASMGAAAPEPEPPPPPSAPEPALPAIPDAALGALHDAIRVNFRALETSPEKQAQGLAKFGRAKIEELDADQAKQFAALQVKAIAGRKKNPAAN